VLPAGKWLFATESILPSAVSRAAQRKYPLTGALTEEIEATTYNNFL